ncbi:hypothetical protein SCALM49S_00497 [Streptomyces californicus]
MNSTTRHTDTTEHSAATPHRAAVTRRTGDARHTGATRRIAVAAALTGAALFTAAAPALADDGRAAPPKLTATTLEAAHEAATEPATLTTLSRFFAREGAVSAKASEPRIEGKAVPVRTLSAAFVAGKPGAAPSTLDYLASTAVSSDGQKASLWTVPGAGGSDAWQVVNIATGDDEARYAAQGARALPGGTVFRETADRRLVRPRHLPGPPARRGRADRRGGEGGHPGRLPGPGPAGVRRQAPRLRLRPLRKGGRLRPRGGHRPGPRSRPGPRPGAALAGSPAPAGTAAGTPGTALTAVSATAGRGTAHPRPDRGRRAPPARPCRTVTGHGRLSGGPTGPQDRAPGCAHPSPAPRSAAPPPATHEDDTLSPPASRV